VEVSSQNQKKLKNLRLKAFTLAEVLIVLAIVGMIANMTIPTLMNNVGEKQNKVAWVKKYSEINQLLRRMNADYIFPVHLDASLNSAFAGYILTSKKCDHSVTEGCWHAKWYSLEGVQVSTVSSDTPGYIMNDGSLFVHRTWYAPDTAATRVFDIGAQIPQFLVDVNGFKGPNKQGYDIFGGYLGAQGIVLSTNGTCDRTNFADNAYSADLDCSRKVILGENY
jgi:prepilin-type N-terminal cleavage/methylation domain-containing protein